ncbi:MAG: NAD(P)-binding domain-containing protein [Gluconacetobacter diazotrophicus]|nr:NAD(P)-binding domain-containing protein [Gluconacetobacter diazotrophicus]
MGEAIIGFGAVGQALARAFSRKGLAVTVAGRRPPAELAAQAAAIGPAVRPAPIEEAATADTVILAMPFDQHRAVAGTVPDWSGRLLIDATNAFGVPPDTFGGLTASEVVAGIYPGSRVVKGFNHLPAAILAADPEVRGGRRVIFVAGDDGAAMAIAGTLIRRLGYAPVSLGGLAEGGVLTQARGNTWSPLDFQDLVKFEEG